MNILDVLRVRSIDAERKPGASNNEYCSPCPVCGGNDRFVTWPDDNRWYCRQCDQGGNLVAFFKFADGLDEEQALEQFFICQGKSASDAADAARAAIKKQAGQPTAKNTPIRRERKPTTQPKPVSKVDISLWREKAATLIEWAHTQLLNNQEQLDWLQNERGLTLETIRRHKIGYNPADLYRDRAAWGLSEKLHKTTGKPKKLWIPRGIILPGYDAAENLCRIKIRRPKDEPKYILLSGSDTSAAFYGGRDLNKYAVVESELDAILLTQVADGLVCPISTGSAAMKPDAVTLELIGNNECLLMFDSDEAGIKAAVKTWLKSLGGSKLWILPKADGKDCTEAYRNGVDLRLVIDAGLDGGTIATTPTPEPLAERELSDSERCDIVNKAYERQHAQPDPRLSSLIAEMEAADGNNAELNKALIKINSFLQRGT